LIFAPKKRGFGVGFSLPPAGSAPAVMVLTRARFYMFPGIGAAGSPARLRALGEKGVLFCVFSKVPAVTFYG